MGWDAGPPPRRGRRRVLLPAAATVLLLAAAAFLGLHRGAAPARPAAGAAAPPPSAAARKAVAAAVPGAAPLLLPTPAVAGSGIVPLGYLHSALGAASAGWRWIQVLYGLDPARAAAAAAACADPTFRDAAARAAATTLAVRAGLGLAAAGPTNPGYLVVTPRMLLIADPDPDRPVIDVLATADLGTAGGARTHRVQVLELHLHWTATTTGTDAGGGDYRLLDRDADRLRVAGLTADPDTPAAYRLGWRDAVPAEAVAVQPARSEGAR